MSQQPLVHDSNPVRRMKGILARPFMEAEDFLPQQKPVCLPGSTTVRACLAVMEKKHLRSCLICVGCPREQLSVSEEEVPLCTSIDLIPSQVKPTSDDLTQHFRMLDLRDVLKFFLDSAKGDLDALLDDRPSDDSPTTETPEGDAGISLLAARSSIRDVTDYILGCSAESVAGFSGQNNFIPCWEDESFQRIIQAFEASPRVPIFRCHNETGVIELVRVFSATDLFSLLQSTEFLANLDPESSSAFNQALGSPARASTKRSVETALETDPLLKTLIRMSELGYTAMPVVEKDRPFKAMGVISVRDLRHFVAKPESMGASLEMMLRDPTLNYVSRVRQMDCQTEKFPSINVKEFTPLQTVVQKMLAADVQRIFLVDDQANLTGIFSRTDLGRLVARVIEGILINTPSPPSTS